ncbi:MAG: hypothetical protein TREMPRED_004834 [Tremellales sp. Tagirdzhanova-0007]|nr:MAG: hypothetical protein TREMPRED_004834 [Tremellales sp. Tagirdzhanova-0007]
MSFQSKPQLYEFSGSCWSNVPKLAISETGYKSGDIEWISINLAEGANFNPEYLKINKEGTVPALVSGGNTFTDSTTVVTEIVKLAPHPPRVHAHTSTSIIEEIHAAAHDPNATLLFSRDDQDRDSKINGMVKPFLEGRQKALDKYAPDAPSEFKSFLTSKQKDNKQLLEFYTGNPDASLSRVLGSIMTAEAAQLWKSVGIAIRGVITQALNKNGGPFAAGDSPSEVDFHMITWLSRTITNTGVEPGSPSSEVIPKLQEYTGGHTFDPVVGKYWDAWIARDSFKDNKIH